MVTVSGAFFHSVVCFGIYLNTSAKMHGTKPEYSKGSAGRQVCFQLTHCDQVLICLSRSLCVCVCLCVSAQSYPTLGDSTDCRPPGSSSMEFSRQEYWGG